MKNVINYYYNMNVIYIYKINELFYFNYNNNDYFFMIFDRKVEDIQNVYQIYIEVKKRKIVTNDIILNKDNKIITFIENVPYILIKDNTKGNRITLNDIIYMQNNTYNIFLNKKNKNNWIKLWEEKIDYYENQINSISKFNNYLNDNIDFYIGLGENAISYLKYNNVIINGLYLSHRRINIDKNSFDFYNPINYVIDNKVRDFAEYTKSLFFNSNFDFNKFVIYLDYMNYNRYDYIFLIARLLFPTYYFDMLDSIISNNLDNITISVIVNKTDSYLFFIKKIMLYIVYQKGISIPFIEWIIKDVN